MENDCTLLRSFDLEAVKRGELICINGEDMRAATYITGPDKAAHIFVEVGGYVHSYFHTALRMEPLCWIDGKPVYKGDTLYSKDGDTVTVVGFDGSDFKTTPGQKFGCTDWSMNYLKTSPLMVNREGWINIYPNARDYRGVCSARTGGVFPSQEIADKLAESVRIDCVRIEWEEPAK